MSEITPSNTSPALVSVGHQHRMRVRMHPEGWSNWTEWRENTSLGTRTPDYVQCEDREIFAAPTTNATTSAAMPDAAAKVQEHEDTSDHRRELALQFDCHRIDAMSMLRGVVAGVTTREDVDAFLSKPPLSAGEIVAELRDLRVQAEQQEVPSVAVGADLVRIGSWRNAPNGNNWFDLKRKYRGLDWPADTAIFAVVPSLQEGK